jgi:hypothetical protein
VRFDDKTTVAGYDPDRIKAQFDATKGDTWDEKVKNMRREHDAAKRGLSESVDSGILEARRAMNYNSFMGLDKNDVMMQEQSLRTKNGGEYGVNWTIVKSKEYTERFNAISNNPDANSLAAQRARNALVNRDGLKSEEIYAISITSGKDVSKITDQYYDFGIKRTEKFNADISRAVDNGESILLIHNHPRGLPPSVTDINELLEHDNVAGITVGHDGSIYYYSRPSGYIEERDERTAYMKCKGYLHGAAKQEDFMQILSRSFGFEFRKM